MNIFHKKFGRRGFTLIELIVVIAVLAIVVTMAVPRYLNQVQDARFVKACSDAKVVEDVILQKIAMAGGAAPIDESTSYSADQVASAIGDDLYDSTGRSVAGVPAGTYYPIDKAEIQNLISEHVDLSHMVMDQDGNLYFAAAAPGDAGEEIVGHVPFPDTVTPVEIAKAAGNLLIYNTVKQVNDSVGGTTDDAHAVYEAVKEDVASKITDWWNGLSVEDQQAFTNKVQTDEDLTVSELIPQDIIIDIVSQSIGYTGTAIQEQSNNYLISSGSYTVSKNQYNQLLAATLAPHIALYGCAHRADWIGYVEIPEVGNKWVWSSDIGHEGRAHYDLYKNPVLNYGDFLNKEIWRPDGWEVLIYLGEVEETINAFENNGVSDGITITPYSNYNPDDQQFDPFYYPVNNLKMADIWDVGMSTDADLQADTAIYTAVESPSYDVSCGASVATPLDYVGDQLVDFNTGLPLNLGSDAPWNTTNGQ